MSSKHVFMYLNFSQLCVQYETDHTPHLSSALFSQRIQKSSKRYLFQGMFGMIGVPELKPAAGSSLDIKILSLQ